MLKINIRPTSLVVYGITQEELYKLYRSIEFSYSKYINDGVCVTVRDHSFISRGELYMLLWKLSTIYDIELV